MGLRQKRKAIVPQLLRRTLPPEIVRHRAILVGLREPPVVPWVGPTTDLSEGTSMPEPDIQKGMPLSRIGSQPLSEGSSNAITRDVIDVH